MLDSYGNGWHVATPFGEKKPKISNNSTVKGKIMNMPMSGQNLLTTAQVAAVYGLAEYLVKDAVKGGQIPCRRVGRQKLMERSDVEDWIRSHPSGGSDDADT